ncbi:hypothetical protein ACM66B_001966 [Microbotryomycetes sp. NB124-2]
MTADKPPVDRNSPSSSNDRLNLKAMFDEERQQELEAYDAEQEKAAYKSKKKQRRAQQVVESDNEEEELDPLLAEEARIDPETLCPFCSRPMPPQPSKTLVKLKAYLTSLDNVELRPTALNPLAMRLPSAQTASFCRLHEDEAVVIPEGKARGWPTTIDWDDLSRRVSRLQDRISSIIVGDEPSHFFELAKEEWHMKGRKVKTVMSEFESFEIEQPGYYGPRGIEVMSDRLKRMCYEAQGLVTSERIAPLDKDWYMRRVLVPETAVLLILQDYDLDDPEQGRKMCEESRAYGRAMFPSATASDDADFADQIERFATTQRRATSLEIEILSAAPVATRKRSDLLEVRSSREESVEVKEAPARISQSASAAPVKSKTQAIHEMFESQATSQVKSQSSPRKAQSKKSKSKSAPGSSDVDSSQTSRKDKSSQNVLELSPHVVNTRNGSDSDASIVVSSPPQKKLKHKREATLSSSKVMESAKKLAPTSEDAAQLRAALGDSDEDDLLKDFEIKKGKVEVPWNSKKIKKRAKNVFSGAAEGILQEKKKKKKKKRM